MPFETDAVPPPPRFAELAESLGYEPTLADAPQSEEDTGRSEDSAT